MQAGTERRGLFVTLEGPDGAGKTSQAIRLREHLTRTGHEVVLTREPGGTPLGEVIRTLLLQRDDVARSAKADALLFNAARSELVTSVIRPALERGETVVSDRFGDSTLAYQGYGAGLGLRELHTLTDWATGGLRPDLTILLDLPVEEGLRRRARGEPTDMSRFEREPAHDAAFHRRVRDGFLSLAADDPGRWRIVDAARDPEAVASDVRGLVDAVRTSGEPASVNARIYG